MRGRYHLACLLVLLLGVTCLEAYSCSVTPIPADDAESLKAFERLKASLDSGDHSRSTLWQFAQLARRERTRQAVIDRLTSEHNNDPSDVAIAEAMYRALVAAEDYRRAADAAAGVRNAYCGNERLRQCSAQDAAYLEAYARRLEFDARAEDLAMSEELSAVMEQLEFLLQEAVVHADLVDAGYVLPDQLAAALLLGRNHIAIDARGHYAKALQTAGRADEAVIMWREALNQCPRFHEMERCQEMAEGVAWELERAGRAFNGEDYYR